MLPWSPNNIIFFISHTTCNFYFITDTSWSNSRLLQMPKLWELNECNASTSITGLIRNIVRNELLVTFTVFTPPHNHHHLLHDSAKDGKFLKAIMKELHTLYFQPCSDDPFYFFIWIKWSDAGMLNGVKLRLYVGWLRWQNSTSQLPLGWFVKCET